MAGLIVFAVAVSTTQVALWAADKEADAQIERLSRVYLAGVAEAVGPMLRAGDEAGFQARFAEAVADHEGIVERVLFAFKRDGALIATAGDAAISPDEARQIKLEGFRVNESAGMVWTSRGLAEDSDLVLVAGLDISEIVTARQDLRLAVVGVDFIIAAVCGLLAYFALRRMNGPLENLARQLTTVASGAARPFPEEAFQNDDARIQSLYRSFNRLVESFDERERLKDELAEREQAAALGRMAATIAHEVRNPLGGLSTAVSTLKRFGDDPAVREESLGFLERGIEALDQIVRSTLNVYRPEDERRLTAVDFADMERLVRPAADKASLTLAWEIKLPESLSIASTGARQILLNLLLNACAATPPGGRVGLEAFVEEDMLVCIVTDQGPGLAPAQADRLSGDAPATGSQRLGIDVIVGLLRALEGRASVKSDPETGAEIAIYFPLERDDG